MRRKQRLFGVVSLALILVLFALPGAASAQTAQQAAIARADAKAHSNGGVVLVYDSKTDSWTAITAPGGWLLTAQQINQEANTPAIEPESVRSTTAACLVAGVFSISACNDNLINFRAFLPRSWVKITKTMEYMSSDDVDDWRMGSKAVKEARQAIEGNDAEAEDSDVCRAGSSEVSAGFGDVGAGGVADGLVGDTTAAVETDFGSDIIESAIIIIFL